MGTIDCNCDINCCALIWGISSSVLERLRNGLKADGAYAETAFLTGLTTDYGSLGCFCPFLKKSVVLAPHKRDTDTKTRFYKQQRANEI